LAGRRRKPLVVNWLLGRADVYIKTNGRPDSKAEFASGRSLVSELPQLLFRNPLPGYAQTGV
jgi:hypothetical protein